MEALLMPDWHLGATKRGVSVMQQIEQRDIQQLEKNPLPSMILSFGSFIESRMASLTTSPQSIVEGLSIARIILLYDYPRCSCWPSQ